MSKILLAAAMLTSSFCVSWADEQYGPVAPAKNKASVVQFLKQNFADTEKTCLALAIYHEARGESLEGQSAVATVVMNRKASRAYPNTICGVVYQNAHLVNRCQFSFACDPYSDVPRNKKSWKVSLDLAETHGKTTQKLSVIITSRDFPVSIPQRSFRFGSTYAMQNATHYHADYVKPDWSSDLIPAGRIGRHLFYVSDRVLRKG